MLLVLQYKRKKWKRKIKRLTKVNRLRQNHLSVIGHVIVTSNHVIVVHEHFDRLEISYGFICVWICFIGRVSCNLVFSK